MYMLIPNVSEVEKSLGEFAAIMEADEVLLFEKSTFLIIAHAQRTEHRDVHRFEKISNIIKQFKLSCIKLAAQFTVKFLLILFQIGFTVHCQIEARALKTFRTIKYDSYSSKIEALCSYSQFVVTLGHQLTTNCEEYPYMYLKIPTLSC